MNIVWKGKGLKEVGLINNKIIIRVDPRYFRPTEVESLLGDASKAKKKLNWQPKINFKELVSEMINEDLKIAQKEELIKKNGYLLKNKYE
jgi:GDPmannose 4,6-dehydratase